MLMVEVTCGENELGPVGKGRWKIQLTARWNVDMGPEISAWQGSRKAGALGLVSSQLTERVGRSLLIFFF